MYKKMYYRLAGILDDAIDLLERGKYMEAKNILIRASRDAENIYVLWEESAAGDKEAMKEILRAECGYPEKLFMRRMPECMQELLAERETAPE